MPGWPQQPVRLAQAPQPDVSHRRILLLQAHAASVCHNCNLTVHVGALVHRRHVAEEAQHVRRDASDARCPGVPANGKAAGGAGRKPCRIWRACAKLRHRNPDAGARASAARASSGVANTASAESSLTHLRAPHAQQARRRLARAGRRPAAHGLPGKRANRHGLLWICHWLQRLRRARQGAPEHRPQRPQVQRLQPGLQLGAGGGGRQPVRLQDVRPVKHQPPVRRRRRAGPAVAARRGGRGRRGRLPGPSRGGAVSAPGRGRGCWAVLEHQAVQACVQVLPVPVCRCTAAACHALQQVGGGGFACRARLAPGCPSSQVSSCSGASVEPPAGPPACLASSACRNSACASATLPCRAHLVREAAAMQQGEQGQRVRPRGPTCCSCSAARSLKRAACSAAAPASLPCVRLSALAPVGHRFDMARLLAQLVDLSYSGLPGLFRVHGAALVAAFPLCKETTCWWDMHRCMLCGQHNQHPKGKIAPPQP